MDIEAKEDVLKPTAEVVKKEPKTLKINAKKAAIVAGLLAILAVGFLLKGLVVAATVNGSPISRASVTRELEQQGGKAVLDALITEKLIETEALRQGAIPTEDDVTQEIKKLEEQVKMQGGTLKDALAQQGLTEEKLREQIRTQIEIEKLLADKVAVTDEEIEAFLSENKITLPEESDKALAVKEQIRDQLKDKKLQENAKTYVETLKTSAKIKYYATY
ncbi:hypothetical protein BH11PAT2_BH11PAT2_04670 [soil metagenome]